MCRFPTALGDLVLEYGSGLFFLFGVLGFPGEVEALPFILLPLSLGMKKGEKCNSITRFSLIKA